jgi:hypothetical protein
LAFREWPVKDRVGFATINMEMGVIRRILKRAKRWHLIAAEMMERHPVADSWGSGNSHFCLLVVNCFPT